MVHMAWLWLKQRWQVAGAVGVVALALLLVALVTLHPFGAGIYFLGDASAARPAASGPSGAVLPRSDIPLLSVLDKTLPPSDSLQTIAAAQASWSAAEIAQHQDALLAAINCARAQRGQDPLALDSALSATAGDAWLKLVHDPSWSLMQLPGTYSLRGVVSLDFVPPEGLVAQSQRPLAGHSTTGPGCTVGALMAVPSRRVPMPARSGSPSFHH
jgi:hypothetical protein